MADQAGSSEHSALCLRLMQLFPRVTRGMRRWQDRAAPAPVPSPLSPRHVAALEQIRGGPLTVGELASRLDLTLPTVSGVLADLDRAGLVERRPDPADRRRGVAKALLGRAFAVLAARGDTSVVCEVDDTNVASISLLTGLGARRYGGNVELIRRQPSRSAPD